MTWQWVVLILGLSGYLTIIALSAAAARERENKRISERWWAEHRRDQKDLADLRDRGRGSSHAERVF